MTKPHSITLDIGDIPIVLHTDNAEFARMVENRYGPFVNPQAGPAAMELEVKLLPSPEGWRWDEGLDERGAGGADASDDDVAAALLDPDDDVKVSLTAGLWTMQRGDFHAEWDPATRRGWVQQTINPYSIDGVLRILHSLVLAREGGLLIHGASAVRNGKAFIFAGISGTGKTTISRLAPPDVKLLTDEISYVRDTVHGGRETGQRTRDAGLGISEWGHGTQDSGIGNRELGLGNSESGIVSRESEFAKRDSGIGARDSGIGNPESGIGPRESELGRRSATTGQSDLKFQISNFKSPSPERRAPNSDFPSANPAVLLSNPNSPSPDPRVPSSGPPTPDPDSLIPSPESLSPNPHPLTPNPGFLAYGTPFAGELAKIGEKLKAPLAGLFLLKQGPENRIEQPSEAQAVRELMRHILFFAHDSILVNMVFETVCQFVRRVPVQRLVFKKDAGVWDLIG